MLDLYGMNSISNLTFISFFKLFSALFNFSSKKENTQKNKNAYDITLSRGAGFDLIVCVGGDGTLKETVAGVMTVSYTHLFGTPAGARVLSRELRSS